MIRLVQRRLIIPRGDTGAFSIPALPSLQEGNNIAVFTIFSAVTRKKIFDKRIAKIENGNITVEFEHKDTVNLPVGRYLWDIKIYNTPEFKNGDIETGDLVDGKVVDSYYSAFRLPECEITPSGDALLTADDAPHTTLPPDQINILRTAVSDAKVSEQAAASSAEEASQSAQNAAASAETATQAAENAATSASVAVEAASEIKDLSVEATTLATGSSATASYDSDTGVLSLGIPRGDDYILTNQDKEDIAAIAEAGLAPSLDEKADKADTVLLTSLSRGRAEDTTIGEASFAFGRGVIASGLASHAEGSNNVASAASTHAEGDSNVASASCAHVEGQSNTASGSYSHAEGRGTIASASGAHTEGNYTTANNGYAHAEGSYTVAKGESSHAEGVGTGINGTHQFRDGSKTGIAATGTADHTEGYFTRTEADGSHTNYGNHAEGYETVAGSATRQTQGAHAEGQQSVAQNTAAHAEGYRTTASGYSSHTEGVGATASAVASHAEGNATTASGADSHAEGGGTAARGAQAHAEGGGSIASGAAAHAEGGATIASKDAAHAEGSYTIANGIAAHAEGDTTIATGTAVHAGGKFNVDLNANTNIMAEIIGNGTAEKNRSNAYALSWEGDGYYHGDVYVNCDANSANGTKVATVDDLSDLSDSVAATYYTKPSGGIPASDLAETYITTETDPTVPAWAKAAQKPSYTAAEVGATTEQQVSSMIATAIGDIHSFDMAVVQALPTEDISTHTIYLVPKTGETNDVYDEYIYVNDAWEMVGNTQIDLSNYVQKTDYATENTPGIIKIGGALKQSSSGDGILLVVPADDRMLKTSVNANFPITPSIQHASTFYGLAKAAGDYTQSYSTNTVGTYTAAAKTAIQTMLDVPAKADVPTKTSDLTNDSGFLTSYTETDPTVPQWAKAATKPSYTAAEVGALPDDTHIPSTTAELTNDAGFITDANVPTKISDLTNDSDFMRQYYGVCNTDGATAAKQVTISNLTSITTGTTILVKFNAANTVSNPKLEINGGEQIPIYRGASAAGSSASASWIAGSVVQLTYDGTNWVIDNSNNTTYGSMTDAQVTAGTSTNNLLISPARVKLGVETHAPVKSVNGQTGAVEVNAVDYSQTQQLTEEQQLTALANLGLNAAGVPTQDEVYSMRAVPSGNKVKIDQIVGGTVAFNQLTSAKNTTAGRDDDNSPINLTNAEGGNRTFQSASAYNYTTVDGHKYFITWTVTNAVDGGGADGTGHDTYSCSLVGKTSGNRTVQNETVYRIYEGTTSSSQHKTNVYFYLSQNSNSATGAITLTNVMLIDLTQMFGSTIADYLASLENPVGGATNTGAGVALFREMFPESYYPYNAGELLSVQTSGRKTVGFNKWDGEYEAGKWIANDGTYVIQTDHAGYNVTSYIPVIGGGMYYHSITGSNRFLFYNSSKTPIPGTDGSSITNTNAGTFTVPVGAAYMRATVKSEYLLGFIVNISDPARNGVYEPYSSQTYPLDSTLTMRGIPVLTDGKVAYNGDSYKPDGTVTRRYGIVDLGTLSWSAVETAVTGVYRMRTNGLSSLIKPSTSASVVGNLLCQKYPTFSWNKSYNADSGDGIAVASSSGAVCVNDSAYNTASSADAFKTAMSGVYLVYELATPTTETAAPYQEIQIAGSTEEFLPPETDTRPAAVPVGVTAGYYNASSIDLDLSAKADKVANATSGNFAALDSEGNLVDSGHKHSDYLTAHQDLSNYVQKTDLATESNAGVVKIAPALGISSYGGYLMIAPANDAAIKAGNGNVATITATSQHQSVFYGLAKAAGDTTQSSSSNSVGTYTDAAKGAIQKMLGVTDLFGNEENDVTATRAYAVGEAFVSNGKLYRATAAIAQDGAIVTSGTGSNCVEISVTEDFIKRTDYATSSTAGVVKVNSDYGIRLNENNVLRTSGAQENHIQGGVNTYLPITPYHQHEAVYFGLAKAAGVDLKNESLYTWSSPMNYTDTAKAAINNMIGSTSKAALENAGITGYTYSEKLGGQFSVTTKTTSGYSYPYARASVTGRFSKHYRHRVTVNGTVYDLKTRLWFVPGKVYEYLGNLNLYVSDISGVPGGTDDVPFVIISDLNDSSSIDVITQTAGTYTIFIEQITPTKKVLPKSLIWDDEYVPIEKKNNGGTYNGFSIGVNELKNTRATFAAGYNNSINGEFSEVIGFSNINNGSSSAIIGFGNTSSGARSHVFGYNNTNTALNAAVVGSMNNNSGITSVIIGLGNTNQGHQNTLIGELNQTSSDALSSTLIGNSLLSGSQGTTIVGNGNVLSTNKTYTNWAGNTHYQVGDCVYNTTDYKYYQCLEENTDATFTASKWKKLPFISNACFIVGNGRADDRRSNALSIDWDGNAKFGGNVYVNCAIDSTGGNKLISEVDYATSSTAGVVKVSADQGIRLTDDGVLCIQRADNAMIKAGENFYQPVTSLNVYAAAFYGLAKAAGDTTQSSSSNAVGTYTAEAKGAIRAMLDVDDSIVEEYINSTSPSITAGPNCRYICGEVTSVSFTPCASGSCELMFTSGSTLAVLTLPSTVKMPEWFEVETNTIYDIIITNGVYGAVMSWPL